MPVTIPLALYWWGPLVVLLAFWLMGVWSRRQGIVRALEADRDGYGVEDVRALFEHYGERGRVAYRSRILPADAAFAALYALVGLGLALGLVQRGQPLWLAALCGGGWILGGLVDIAEGFALARLLDRHPALEAHVVARASRLTQAKLVLFALGILGVIAALYFAAPHAGLTYAL